jgi:phytol kinase
MGWYNSCAVDTLYRRRLRKTIHILAGFPAFMLPLVSYSLMVATAVAALAIALLLRPDSQWLRAMAKPEDFKTRSINGVRHYFATILILIALFGLRYPEIAMAGWLAMAWGDGAAGLVGPKEGLKLPWSKRKTVAGFVSCWICVWLAADAAFFVAGVTGTWTAAGGQAFIAASALAVAFLESWKLPVDDNYSVGLGAAALLFAGKITIHLF